MNNEEKNSLLVALETERRYIARELHDGVAQTALQLGLYGGICKKLVERNQIEQLVEQLTEMEERIQKVSAQIRELIADFRPPLIDPSSGLLEYLQYTIELHHERNGATVTFRDRLNGQIPQYSMQEILTISRIVQEALHNVRKHAKAENVLVDIVATNQKLTLTIADDGQGFDLEEVEKRSGDKGGAGIDNMHARAVAIGGYLRVTKGTKEGGTAVRLTVPLSQQPWW